MRLSLQTLGTCDSYSSQCVSLFSDNVAIFGVHRTKTACGLCLVWSGRFPATWDRHQSQRFPILRDRVLSTDSSTDSSLCLKDPSETRPVYFPKVELPRVDVGSHSQSSLWTHNESVPLPQIGRLDAMPASPCHSSIYGLPLIFLEFRRFYSTISLLLHCAAIL